MPNEEFKIITCVLYPGGGTKVLEALWNRGVTTGNTSYARGSAMGDPIGKDGIPVQFEKEILTAIVRGSEADEIFELVFEVAEINRPHGGFLYMETLRRSVPHPLPSLPLQDD